ARIEQAIADLDYRPSLMARGLKRGQQIVGRRFTLDNALINGRGHMRVGDSSWPVVADDDLSAGTRVEVIAVEGITLRVKAC
ncbi:NfeD family protein, partial [Enterobacter hormaechei subsp. steigerwaltii]|nr:NfeD family protein [Enterobacter hormaechei subsp. steigerwaltii]